MIWSPLVRLWPTVALITALIIGTGSQSGTTWMIAVPTGLSFWMIRRNIILDPGLKSCTHSPKVSCNWLMDEVTSPRRSPPLHLKIAKQWKELSDDEVWQSMVDFLHKYFYDYYLLIVEH